ncbi:four-helix bundle copper-binding protein [Candidatus Woesearchaeota archaeon]|nr:four-helix bundle copper-binding protein [Candidatus Woesearchaeota archaeon]
MKNVQIGEDILQNSLECFRSCEETIAYCLSKGGRHVKEDHIKRLQDCADLCLSTSSFIARDSELAEQIASLCAQACDSCAESCDALKDARMQDCAETCRRCSESCKELIGLAI